MEPGKEKFLIKGLAGKKKLNGTITVGGSKNTALKLLASTLLFKDTVLFENIPDIADTRRIIELLDDLGAEVERTGVGSYSINTKGIKTGSLQTEIAKRLRASIVFTGPLLARFGKVSFPHPGGCVIGERPIDLFLQSFKKMGAKIEEKEGEYIVSAPKGLRGAEIVFKIVSVTGTETLLMAAVLAKGKTILRNAALEPEVKHLGDFLIRSGAKIKGIGTSVIEIEGGGLLKVDGKVYLVPPDRIEAGSFLILGALAANNLEIKNCVPEELSVPIDMLRQSGVKIRTTKNKIILANNGKIENRNLKGIQVKTHEYPGFPTDLQAPMTVYLTQVSGDSLVFETIFEGRLSYTEDLVRMGGNILMLDPHRVMVKGPRPLRGRELESPDLRAGLAFLIAAIVAKGESILNNVEYVDRGYEAIEKRLRPLGVKIDRVR
jgi:UDP-N-acetylglucosamine 1-carboxyvinyltransferase